VRPSGWFALPHKYGEHMLQAWEHDGLQVADEDREMLIHAMARVAQQATDDRVAAFDEGLLRVNWFGLGPMPDPDPDWVPHLGWACDWRPATVRVA